MDVLLEMAWNLLDLIGDSLFLTAGKGNLRLRRVISGFVLVLGVVVIGLLLWVGISNGNAGLLLLAAVVLVSVAVLLLCRRAGQKKN